MLLEIPLLIFNRIPITIAPVLDVEQEVEVLLIFPVELLYSTSSSHYVCFDILKPLTSDIIFSSTVHRHLTCHIVLALDYLTTAQIHTWMKFTANVRHCLVLSALSQ